ncbi:MAG: ChaN family lipoprotein [Polyangiaceae bacterium]
MILDVAAGRRITEAELVAGVQAAPIVLVGEIHDNPDHHRLEARLLQSFATTHPAPAVVFEMLDRGQQPTIDASLAAHPADADALARAVAWDSSGWPPWSMYRPVFEAALGAHAPILAAGIDRRDAMRIAHDRAAAFDPALVHPFGLDAPLPPDDQAAVRREMNEVHCGLLPESMLDTMVLVQRSRDALMAERLHEGTAGGRGALLVAGAGHVRRDRGVPVQLARAYAARALAIGLVPVRDADTVPESYVAGFDATGLPFDFVWFTPRTDDVDHCAEMRAHIGEKR